MTGCPEQPKNENSQSYEYGKSISNNAAEFLQSLFPEVNGKPKFSISEAQLIITSMSMALDIPKIEMCKKIAEYSIKRKMNRHNTQQRLMMARLRKILPGIDFE